MERLPFEIVSRFDASALALLRRTCKKFHAIPRPSYLCSDEYEEFESIQCNEFGDAVELFSRLVEMPLEVRREAIQRIPLDDFISLLAPCRETLDDVKCFLESI